MAAPSTQSSASLRAHVDHASRHHRLAPDEDPRFCEKDGDGAMVRRGEEEEKWRGKVEWEVRGGWGAEQVWGMAGDFCGMKRWVPSLDACERVAGEENRPRCVRYMEAGGKRSDGAPVRWVLEELLDWSPRHYTYTMLDSGYGLTGYLATLQLITVSSARDADSGDADSGDADSGDGDSGDADSGHGDSGDADSGHGDGDGDPPPPPPPPPRPSSGVVLQWTFEVDPSALFGSHHGFLAFFSATFERMMLSLEAALGSYSSSSDDDPQTHRSFDQQTERSKQICS